MMMMNCFDELIRRYVLFVIILNNNTDKNDHNNINKNNYAKVSFLSKNHEILFQLG